MNYNKLKQLREASGLSSEELAKQLQFAKSIMWSYELGKKEPSIQHLKKISRFFDVSVDYLLDQKRDNLLINLVDEQELSSCSFLVDNVPISQDEMNEAIAFIRNKRMTKGKTLHEGDPGLAVHGTDET